MLVEKNLQKKELIIGNGNQRKMIKMYIRKSNLIEAIQYNGQNFQQLADFVGQENIFKNEQGIFLHTLEGDFKMKNPIGDYVLKDSQGKCYFSERNIFKEKYQEI